MASRIQIRRDTAANWSANNPTLASGEIAFVTDENKVKIGDGGTAWNSLAYLEADAYLDSVVMGDDTTGNYVETLIASDGISISGEGQESASVTVTNTGVLSLAGTTNEIEVSAASGNITLSLPTSITVDVVGDVTGNADTASALATPRNISLGGDVSGSASFDGSSDITITATVADDSHSHTIANVDGLQTAIDTAESDAVTSANSYTDSEISTHNSDTTSVHGIADTSALATKTYADNAGVTSLTGTASEVEVSASTGSVTLSLPATINADTTGNAATASTLETARSISLGGDVSGSASFDGGSNISITATVADDSHNHTISNVDGLQSALDAKAPLASPTLTGTPAAPTATAGNNSTQIATTAFVQTAVGNLIDGAPGALDTLNELAASLGDDADFAGTVTNSLAGKQPLDADLTAIAGLAGTSGLLKKDAADTWSLDTNTYLTGNETITVSGDATGSGTTSISLTLANSGVSASTYGSSSQIPVLTVDSKGRITSASAASVEGLPSQTGNSGKYLTTNGTAASWDTINLGTDTAGNYVASISGTANEIEVTGSGSENASVTLSLPATINANTTGSAASLTTARTISLGGDLSGSASFNGTSNITITAAVADDSHNHTVSNIDGLQNDLDAKLDSTSYTASDVLTKIKTVDGSTSGLDSDLLDGQHGSYYLDWTNVTNKPDPTITLGGDASGSVTLTNLGNGTLTVTVADDSHNHIISNVDGLQTALNAKLNSSSYTAADVLAKIKTVDGAGSGLDADLLDGQSSAYYRNVGNFNAGTLAIARGGTNTTATPTDGGIAYGTGSAIAYTAAGTTGQVLTSNGTSAPTWQAAAASGFNGFFLAGM